MSAQAPKPTLRERVAGVTDGAPFLPLLLLFGLNAVDELDRSAFGLLTPEIRDDFGLNYKAITFLTAAVIPASLLFALPIARWADRHKRAPVAIIGAATWGVFSVLTGLAPALLLLGLARVGAGLGRAVNGPTHPALLSDYYPASARAKVISSHRIANPVGQFAAPLIAGFIAAAVGWRTPFIVLAVPTFLIVFLALRWLREPERTGDRLVEEDPGLRAAFRSLMGVRTLRRLYLAIPFLAFVAIGLQPLNNLYFKDVFGVPVHQRGIIQAFDGPFTIVGLAIGAVLINRGLLKDPGRALKTIGFAGFSIGVFIFGLAVAPNVGLGITFNYATNVLTPVLYTGGIVIVSLVTPPESRASAFALFEIFSLAGVVALPIVGVVADEAGLRTGIGILPPVLFIGASLVITAGRFVREDIKRIYPDYGAPSPQDPIPPVTLTEGQPGGP